MGLRAFLSLLAICLVGPLAVIALLVKRPPAIAREPISAMPDVGGVTRGSSVQGAMARVSAVPVHAVDPARAPVLFPREIDTSDPWTGEPLPPSAPGVMQHRFVIRPVRPIDMTDPWDPTRSYAPKPEEVAGVLVAGL